MPLKLMPTLSSFAAYAATLAAMLLLDGVWLGLVARPLYEQGIGHLMAKQPNLAAAAVFYLVYALGLTLIAVLPHAGAGGWRATLVVAATLGFVAYATYDLTNLATLAGWPLGLSFLDMAWGTAISICAAAAGKLALERLGGA